MFQATNQLLYDIMHYLNLQDRQKKKKHLLNGRPKMVADGLDGLLNGPFHDSLIEVSMATIRIFAVLTRYSIYLSTYPSIYASICTLHSGKYVGIY